VSAKCLGLTRNFPELGCICRDEMSLPKTPNLHGKKPKGVVAVHDICEKRMSYPISIDQVGKEGRIIIDIHLHYRPILQVTLQCSPFLT
jgi:hypothetical protein